MPGEVERSGQVSPSIQNKLLLVFIHQYIESHANRWIFA